MPLRDHFRPPLDDFTSWEVLHGGWPMVIVQQLRTILPPGYVAGPRVHHGAQVEVDVAASEQDAAPGGSQPPDAGGGGATAAWAAALPVVAVEAELPGDDAYEVRVYDARRKRTLVAAIEIVSPANKVRPESRNAFVGKCAALLRKGVAVSVVDVVTTRRFNLFAELMAFIGHPTADPPPLYAASGRWVPRGKKTFLESVSYPLAVGQPLPTLPLWLSPDRVVPLDLERSYEQACRDLWIA
jgi:hypothetical protein